MDDASPVRNTRGGAIDAAEDDEGGDDRRSSVLEGRRRSDDLPPYSRGVRAGCPSLPLRERLPQGFERPARPPRRGGGRAGSRRRRRASGGRRTRRTVPDRGCVFAACFHGWRRGWIDVWRCVSSHCHPGHAVHQVDRTRVLPRLPVAARDLQPGHAAVGIIRWRSHLHRCIVCRGPFGGGGPRTRRAAARLVLLRTGAKVVPFDREDFSAGDLHADATGTGLAAFDDAADLAVVLGGVRQALNEHLGANPGNLKLKQFSEPAPSTPRPPTYPLPATSMAAAVLLLALLLSMAAPNDGFVLPVCPTPQRPTG